MSTQRGRRWAAILLVASLPVAACGGGSVHSVTAARTTITARGTAPSAIPVATRRPKPRPRPLGPPYPQLRSVALASAYTPLVPAVRWHGRTVAWIARLQSGVAMLAFDQRMVELRLHSGTSDAGSSGWRFGPSVTGSELGHLVAAFNGGFRLSTGAGGFMSYGRVAVALRAGLGSIVTYADGTTDVGAWRSGVPAPGRPVASVRQNLTLLIDHGVAAGSVGCLLCWGATLNGVDDPARSALGVTAGGRLIWVGGENLTVGALASALLAAHVVRAVELDINPEWVAAYLYGHRGGHGPLAPVPVVPGQHGIPGQFLAPWSRDFFTVDTR